MNRANVVCIPGAFTPTEILHAHRNGADVVKVFPSTALGAGFFKDILAPLPFLKLTPTGGVDAKNAVRGSRPAPCASARVRHS